MAKDDTSSMSPRTALHEAVHDEREKDLKAARRVREVDRQHPYSDWAPNRWLMSAYSFYRLATTTAASARRRATVTLHPGSPDASYANT